MGCDYCVHLKGIGPKTAYELIKTNKTLEKALESIEKNKKITINHKNFIDAEQLLFNSIDLIKKSIIPKNELNLSTIQNEEFIDFMHNKHGFDFMKCHNALKRLNVYYNKMNIIRLNTNKVHKIIKPVIPGYLFISDGEDSDSDNEENMKQKNLANLALKQSLETVLKNIHND